MNRIKSTKQKNTQIHESTKIKKQETRTKYKKQAKLKRTTIKTTKFKAIIS